MKQTILLSLGLSAVLLGCHKDPAAPSISADYTYTGTAQNFTPMEFSATEANATNYSWNFGDNTTAQGRNVAHTFRRAGTYTVSLTTTGTKGKQTTFSQPLTLAQADTVNLIHRRLAGRYHCQKVVLTQYSGSTILSVTRLRDTTLNVVSQGQSFTINGYPMAFKSSSMPWYTAGNPLINYFFAVYGGTYYRSAYFQQQGDSMIFTRSEGRPFGTNETFYGRRLP